MSSDVNARIGGLLGDLAAVQPTKQKAFGYKRASAVVLGLDRQMDTLAGPDGRFEKIPGLGPSSMRVVEEVLRTGESEFAEHSIDLSGRRADITLRRSLRSHFLSRAEALRVLADPSLGGPAATDYRGDLQMHSEWSDGSETLAAMAAGCLDRGYSYCAVTDHSYGLPIARGVSMDNLVRQHAEIDQINAECGSRFRLIKGLEANIGTDGTLDISAEEAARMELVLAAPHSRLRVKDDQTSRLVTAVTTPGVHILAHPRGRMAGTRAGVQADWFRVFRAAARTGVAIELDGDPSRQDLDHVLAAEALAAGCLFALDSDAHSVSELRYTDTALAHARLAGIPPSRIVNCWPLAQLLDWMQERQGKRPAKRRRKAAAE